MGRGEAFNAFYEMVRLSCLSSIKNTNEKILLNGIDSHPALVKNFMKSRFTDLQSNADTSHIHQPPPPPPPPITNHKQDSHTSSQLTVHYVTFFYD